MKNSRRLSIISRLLVLIMLFESFAPALSALPGPDDAYADQWVCAQDLNNDGNVTDPGETASCISTSQGELCPISNTTCIQTAISGPGIYITPYYCPGWWYCSGGVTAFNGSGNTISGYYWGSSGSLTISGVTISGSLQVYAGSYLTGQGNTITSYYCYSSTYCPPSPGSLTISGATVSGTIHVSGGDTLYGSGNTIKGTSSTGSLTLSVNAPWTCPLGSQYACMDNGGTMQCSPNQCLDLTTNPPTTTQINDTMYQNDGPTDSNGNCLGQIYIFTGRGSSCQEAGAADSWKDCCANSSQVFSDSAGAAVDVETATSAVETMYHLAQVAYYTNAILASGGTATVSGLSTATLGVQQAVTSGVAAGSAGAGMEAYAAALLNPTTIAITAAIFLAQEFLMQSCTQKDIETASLVSSGYCHYIGEFCSDSWPIIGCVNESKGYCCFNSKLARIIQEQGRPQLQDFGPGGDWGSPDNPNCRGFTPQEFQMLDFSKIDLTSYYGDIEKNMNQNLSNMQTQMKQNVTNFYNNTQK